MSEIAKAEQSDCPRCRGTGRVVGAHVQTCAACDGTGTVSQGYVDGYEEGKRIGRILGIADVTKAVQNTLEDCRP